MGDVQGSSGLFGIFLISVSSLFLIPYTIYRLCFHKEEDVDATQPWPPSGKQKAQSSKGGRLLTKHNVVLAVCWLLWLALLYAVQHSTHDMKPFDPFEILQIEPGASERDIKRAYRKLSLQYHPDKNPDPEASKYFASYITKAYAALTDEAARKNYEKYGHPDGPQGMDVGVALPEWFFAKDKKKAPLVLLALVGCGIMLPLGLVSWYLMKNDNKTGPGSIQSDTVALYFHHPNFGVKELHSLSRIPYTLVCAVEFITAPVQAEQAAALEELRRMVIRYDPELKTKTQFWKRWPGVVKAHMLLLALLERDADKLDPKLQADVEALRIQLPLLLEEILKVSGMPRAPHGAGWAAPSQSAVQMMQSLVQAVPLRYRKSAGKAGDLLGPLMQLPHFSEDTTKRLKRRRVNSLRELLELSVPSQFEALKEAGLGAPEIESVNAFLSILPTVHVAATVENVEGYPTVLYGDVVKCSVRVLLTRPAHYSERAAPLPAKGKPVRAYTPHYGAAIDEAWYFMVSDGSNSLWGWNKASLLEAERQGYEDPDAVQELKEMRDNAKAAGAANGNGAPLTSAALQARSGGKSRSRRSSVSSMISSVDASSAAGSEDDEPGQLVHVVFPSPPVGSHTLTLSVVSNCYLGCDATATLKLTVLPMTAEAAKAREKHSGAGRRSRTRRSSASGSAAASSAGDSDEEGSGYDSEETGSEVSGSESGSDE